MVKFGIVIWIIWKAVTQPVLWFSYVSLRPLPIHQYVLFLTVISGMSTWVHEFHSPKGTALVYCYSALKWCGPLWGSGFVLISLPSFVEWGEVEKSCHEKNVGSIIFCEGWANANLLLKSVATVSNQRSHLCESTLCEIFTCEHFTFPGNLFVRPSVFKDLYWTKYTVQ